MFIETDLHGTMNFFKNTENDQTDSNHGQEYREECLHMAFSWPIFFTRFDTQLN